MNRFSAVVVVLMVGVMIAVSQALKCYECYPNKDDTCAVDKIDTQKTCTGEVACRTQWQKVKGDVSYVRQCTNLTETRDKPLYNSANDYVKVTVHHCYTEFCNAAVVPFASPLVFVLVAAAVARQLV